MSRQASTWWAGGLSLVAILATAYVIARALVPVVRAFSHDTVAATPGDGAQGNAPDAFGERLDAHRARFDGRSVFFAPPKPPPPPPPPAPPVVTREPEPPPPPTRYGGPKIIAMVGDEVWLAPDYRLRVGGEERAGVKVIDTSPPWHATLEWRGEQFEVSFFERNEQLKSQDERREQRSNTTDAVPTETPS